MNLFKNLTNLFSKHKALTITFSVVLVLAITSGIIATNYKKPTKIIEANDKLNKGATTNFAENFKNPEESTETYIANSNSNTKNVVANASSAKKVATFVSSKSNIKNGEDVSAESPYKMLNGSKQTFNKDFGTNLSFRAETDLNTLESIKIDGKIVDSKYYKLSSGSTIVTFKDEYSTTLSSGTHNISIVSFNGAATAPFSVTTGSSYAVSGTVPEGCTYIRPISENKNQIYAEGTEMPTPTLVGDTFVTPDYTYLCNGLSDASGWHVEVNADQKAKTTYKAIYDEINGVGVWNLNNCFRDCTKLTTVPHIPESTIYMCETFSGCSSLTYMPEIPNSVKHMDRAFYNCIKLTTVSKLPDNLYLQDKSHSFGAGALDEAFAGCKSLTNAPEIPDGVTYLYETFKNCTSLVATPNLPSSITAVRSAFYGCTNLKNVTVNSDPTSYWGFIGGCTNVTSIAGSTTLKVELLATKNDSF